jgi:hypothetical protein
MKTNIVMKSPDRMLFDKVIRQETKTGMLNMSDLQEIANKRNAMNGYKIRQLQEILNRDENLERIYFILKEQVVITIDMSKVIENIKEYGLFTYLKKLGQYKTTGARETKTTWANPYIWMLAALELSPELYGKAVIWLGDNLIINRIEAGNFYRSLSQSVSKFSNVDYVKTAKALNYIVFNRHETGIRNYATQSELKELEEIEKHVAFTIDMGFIHSFDQLILFLRKIYNKKRTSHGNSTLN